MPARLAAAQPQRLEADTESLLPVSRKSRRRPNFAAVAGWVAVAAAFAAFVSVDTGPRRAVAAKIKDFWQSSAGNTVRLTLSKGARDTHARANAYFNEQWPHIEAAARRARVHSYFASAKPTTSSIGWFDLIHLRIKTMRNMLKETGDDSFRVEKDRCEMYRFFQRGEVPHVAVLNFWDSLDNVVEAIHSGEAWGSATRWPVFLKACHLTQGSMKAVYLIKSREWAEQNIRRIVYWVRWMWGRRADDYERPWRLDGNALTDSLKPGMMLQNGWHTSRNPYKGTDMAVELKVEVFWGRAYLGVTSDLSVGTVFLRNNVTELYPSLWSQAFFTAEPERRMRWIVDEGHLECVWSLAERTASLIGADSVRIDVFLWEGHPRECVVNEISLSSGMQYSMHYPFLAKAWALPHVRGLYTTYTDPSRVYQQTQSDLARRLTGA
eukprot:TRINITY_DN17050_c0_g1_i2.p1 TRINITY_DN17050_c0_g1~~TRINITY_DN17050_c0_g1_i2.p1  ORF type:complete len:437 (+),score=110.84 TRINITY_DN17050_c0_g1_i2:62-1372(+)